MMARFGFYVMHPVAGFPCQISFDNHLRYGYLLRQRHSASMHPVKSTHVLAPVTALAAVLLPGCRERPDRLAWWEAEQERIELSQRLALAQYQQGNAPPDHTAQLRNLQATTRNLAQRAFDLAQTRTTLNSEIQDLETQLDQLARNALKDQRRSAIGVKYETLALANGKIFHDAMVTGVDEIGVAIRHRDGLARLRCADRRTRSPPQRRQPGTGRGQSQLGRSGPHLAAAALGDRGTHPIS
jgi:hypothetical protein